MCEEKDTFRNATLPSLTQAINTTTTSTTAAITSATTTAAATTTTTITTTTTSTTTTTTTTSTTSNNRTQKNLGNLRKDVLNYQMVSLVYPEWIEGVNEGPSPIRFHKDLSAKIKSEALQRYLNRTEKEKKQERNRKNFEKRLKEAREIGRKINQRRGSRSKIKYATRSENIGGKVARELLNGQQQMKVVTPVVAPDTKLEQNTRDGIELAQKRGKMKSAVVQTKSLSTKAKTLLTKEANLEWKKNEAQYLATRSPHYSPGRKMEDKKETGGKRSSGGISKGQAILLGQKREEESSADEEVGHGKITESIGQNMEVEKKKEDKTSSGEPNPDVGHKVQPIRIQKQKVQEKQAASSLAGKIEEYDDTIDTQWTQNKRLKKNQNWRLIKKQVEEYRKFHQSQLKRKNFLQRLKEAREVGRKINQTYGSSSSGNNEHGQKVVHASQGSEPTARIDDARVVDRNEMKTGPSQHKEITQEITTVVTTVVTTLSVDASTVASNNSSDANCNHTSEVLQSNMHFYVIIAFLVCLLFVLIVLCLLLVQKRKQANKVMPTSPNRIDENIELI